MGKVDVGRLRRVLAVRLDNIGDVIMLTPALRALKTALPQAHLTLLCSPAGSQVAPLLPWVDQVLAREVSWQDASGTLPVDPARERELIAILEQGRYDAAFIFTSWTQSPHPPTYVCYLAGIPIRVGESKEFGGSVLSHSVPQLPDEAHQVDRNLHLVTSVGIPAAGNQLELHVPAAAARSAGAALRSVGIDPDTRYVVAAPGASCSSRRYPAERFAAVAQTFARDMPVVAIGTQKEAGLVERLGCRSLTGRTTVPELAAVINGAALVVANNSGPMHMAEALGSPLIALFAGTELESQFAPRVGPHRLLRKPTRCSPCHAFSCPFDLECLDFPSSTVVEAAYELMEATPT